MADGSKIEWTDATCLDRGGRRTRIYRRQDPTRPGQQLRRIMARLGLAWCRGCADWLPAGDVRQGACRPCLAAEARARYAANPEPYRRRVYARQRRVAALPVVATDYLTEQFGGRCAYCPAPATTWDHFYPVARGGRTEPGNIVAACLSCNSSKKDSDPWEWISSRPNMTPDLLDVVALMEVA